MSRYDRFANYTMIQTDFFIQSTYDFKHTHLMWLDFLEKHRMFDLFNCRSYVEAETLASHRYLRPEVKLVPTVAEMPKKFYASGNVNNTHEHSLIRETELVPEGFKNRILTFITQCEERGVIDSDETCSLNMYSHNIDELIEESTRFTNILGDLYRIHLNGIRNRGMVNKDLLEETVSHMFLSFRTMEVYQQLIEIINSTFKELKHYAIEYVNFCDDLWSVMYRTKTMLHNTQDSHTKHLSESFTYETGLCVLTELYNMNLPIDELIENHSDAKSENMMTYWEFYVDFCKHSGRHIYPSSICQYNEAPYNVDAFEEFENERRRYYEEEEEEYPEEESEPYCETNSRVN